MLHTDYTSQNRGVTCLPVELHPYLDSAPAPMALPQDYAFSDSPSPTAEPSLNPRIHPLCSPRPHKPEPMCASSVKITIVTVDTVPWDTPLGKCYSRLSLVQLLLVSGPQPKKSSATESQTILATTTLTIWQAALPPELQQTLLTQTQSTPAERTEGIGPLQFIKLDRSESECIGTG